MLDAATLPAPAHPDPDHGGEVRAARVEDAVIYTSVLPLPRRVVTFVADLHEAHLAQLRTRHGRRALTAWEQALACAG